MNGQVKYIITASLLLLTILTGFKIASFSSQNFPSNNTVGGCGTVDKTIAAPFTKTGIQGKALFLQYCAACHNVMRDGTGPALIGFAERGPWADRKKLYQWIQNPSAFMKKNRYTRELKESYGTMMTAFPTMTNAEIDAICEYILK
jgi:mono/diheme cytochrome c family protein